MRKKIKLSLGVAAIALFAVLAVNMVMGTTLSGAYPKISAVTEANLEESSSVLISVDQTTDEDQLRKLTPTTPEEAESSIYPTRTRFLMWTHDGVHVMWGIFGNGRFVGTDNLGKRCWGIYGKGIFAGFYDGEFFWGKYDNGAWKAQYLFGLENCHGKYLAFPTPVTTSVNTDSAFP